VLVGYGTTETVVARRPRREASTADGPPPKTTRAYAKPPVRKLARELGIDLHAVPASGRHGEVTRADLTAAAMVRSANQAPPAGAQLRIPVKGVRKYSAHAMVSSAFTAPHVTEWVSADVTKTLALLARVRADSAFDGVRISPLTLIARATLLTIQRHPEINASWDAGTGEIVQYRDVNLGIAAATPRGLIVPNIAAAQSLSFRDLAAALNDLITAARTGKTKPEEMQGGTFTITNIGTFGVDGGTPILNPGEAAILCLGQIRKQPWSHKGRVRLRDVTTLAMSFDHRLVDGELGSRVLADIAGLLERPERALAWY
jgi:pyruvate dehydrogenase E2 component (dihydrolipoamide acetyltransferase)